MKSINLPPQQLLEQYQEGHLLDEDLLRELIDYLIEEIEALHERAAGDDL